MDAYPRISGCGVPPPASCHWLLYRPARTRFPRFSSGTSRYRSHTQADVWHIVGARDLKHVGNGRICRGICGWCDVSDSGRTSQVQAIQCALFEASGAGFSRPFESAVDCLGVSPSHIGHHHRCDFGRICPRFLRELESRANVGARDVVVLFCRAGWEADGGLARKTSGLPDDYWVCRGHSYARRCRAEELRTGVLTCTLLLLGSATKQLRWKCAKNSPFQKAV